MRFRKGQKVRFPYHGDLREAVVEKVCHGGLLLYVDSLPRNYLHGRDGKCFWIQNYCVTRICIPRTRIDKLVNAYCEAEFKQMGISR